MALEGVIHNNVIKTSDSIVNILLILEMMIKFISVKNYF